MLFADALTEVMTTVKRPDKINVARRKLNAAISFYSLDNEFQRDYAEITIPVTPTAYSQAIAISSLERFRKEKYIKPTGTKCYLTPVATADILKHNDLCNKYYIIGDLININLQVLTPNMDIGFFKYPPILTESSPSYWLLEVAPFMIIDRAIGEIMRDIGDERSMQAHMASAREAYLAARKDFGISTQ